MNRLRRSVSIAGSVVIIAGLVAGFAVRGAFSSPAALAATIVPGTDIFGQTSVTSWPDVRSSGVGFVGIQAYNGKTVPNPNYAAQVTGALGQGLYVMPYVFADPLKIAGGAQFAKAWSVIDADTADPYKPGGQQLPIALDLESDPAVTSQYCYGLTPAKMVSWVNAFVSAAKAKTDVVPVIYTSQKWWDQCTASSTAFGGDRLWVADFGVNAPTLPAGWTSYAFWQSSDTGKIGGITGPADLDQLQAAPTVTARAGTGGSVQLETLNVLAGQKAGYVAVTTLPQGVSLTAAGRLSWSSAARVGRHSVTITPVSKAIPAVAVVPATIPVTLRVHGSIILPAKNRSSTVGVRIRLKLTATGPDQKVGAAATLKATGLPKALSMTSAGLITGQLAKPGHYKVTITATDTLGGTGHASFTWTVKSR